MTLSESGHLPDTAVALAGQQHPVAEQTGMVRLVVSVGTIFRYRFFVMAGVFPYLLGCAVAHDATGGMNWVTGILGLVGVICLGLGIEGMNEYFDSQLGGDRVFETTRRTGVWWHLPLGLAGFVAALAAAVCLTVLRGWGVLAMALCGGFVALSYLMPPIRLSHRGLGETAIAVGYGPGLTLGGFYLQAGQLSWHVAVVSLVPGLLMFAMSLANEVPDYHGDRLVGKQNLIVRLGRRNGVILFAAVMSLWFGLIATQVVLGVFPLGLGLCLLLIPLVVRTVQHGLRHCQNPIRYVRIVNTMIVLFVMVNVIAILSYVFRQDI